MEAASSPEMAMAIVPIMMFLVGGMLYIAVIAFFVWAAVSIVRSLRRAAEAQEATVTILRQIAASATRPRSDS